MVTECTFCGQDIFDHDPVFVAEFEHGARIQNKQFCNYTCLYRFIEKQELVEPDTS